MRKVLFILFAAALSSAAMCGADAGRKSSDAKAREIFERVIAMPTSLGMGQVPAMAEYLAGELRAGGFPAEDIKVLPFDLPAEKTAALVVRYRGSAARGGAGGKPILLLAHMDVVIAKREDWQRDPFQLIEENGFFFGRGTADNKQGVTALVSTFLRLKAEGFVPTRDLILFFSGDEETAQQTSVLTVREHRALIDAEYALNSDAGGGTLDEKTGKPLYYYLQTAEKTYADYLLTTRNPGGHSSTPRADNAIYDLAAALTRLRQFSFPVMWNDTTRASLKLAGETTPGELGEALRRFAADPGGDAGAADIISASPAHVGMTRTTCVATRLDAGHANNALPQNATATVNCRIFPGVGIEDVRGTLARVAGEGVEVKVIDEPMSSDASPLRPDVMAAVTRAVRRIHPGVRVVPQQSSGATDGLIFRAAGIPTYGVDPVFIKESDSFAHGLNERLPVASFHQCLEQWYLLLKDLAGGKQRDGAGS